MSKAIAIARLSPDPRVTTFWVRINEALLRLTEELHDSVEGYHVLRHQRDLEALGAVPMQRRLTGIPIICGDCGESEMTQQGCCVSCGGRAFVAARSSGPELHELQPVPVQAEALQGALPF